VESRREAMKRFLAFFLLMGCLLMLAAFNIDNAIVPKEEILSGGPPKDGIPAILKPQFIRPKEAEFLKPDDRVIGVEAGGEARAYPISTGTRWSTIPSVGSPSW
jgi:hypothetical protein